jgi:hypothetical protein
MKKTMKQKTTTAMIQRNKRLRKPLDRRSRKLEKQSASWESIDPEITKILHKRVHLVNGECVEFANMTREQHRAVMKQAAELLRNYQVLFLTLKRTKANTLQELLER